MRAKVNGRSGSTSDGETSSFEIILFVFIFGVVGFIGYEVVSFIGYKVIVFIESKQVKPPKVDIVPPIADKGKSSETKEGSDAKKGSQKKQECTEKDEIEIAKEIVDKNIEHIKKGKKYSVSKFISSLKCIPKSTKKRIMQYCKKNWFTKGSCISVVFGPPTSVMGSAIYDSLKNSDDNEKSAVKYVIIVVEKSPEKPKTKLYGKDNKDDLKNNPKKSEPEKKKSAPTPVLGLTTEDIKKISKNTCIANAKNRPELRESPINSLVLTDKSDEKIMYEWRIKKGEKTTCIFYVKTLGTVIY